VSRALFPILALLMIGCGADVPRAAEPAGEATSSGKEPERDAGLPRDSGTDATADANPPEPPAPKALEIEVVGAKDLSLVEYLMKGERRGEGVTYLVGEVEITVRNPSKIPVELVHMDPANLVFTRTDTGEHFSMIHPCNPGLLLCPILSPEEGAEEQLARTRARSVFELGPGQTRTFEMGQDWGCSGGPWRPVPPPGEYTVDYRIHRLVPGWKPAVVATEHETINDRVKAARAATRSDEFWEGAYRSEPIPISLGRPKVKRLAY